MDSPTRAPFGAPYLDRDLSDLAYVDRILELARDPGTPLAEALRFLGISCAVLDEFVSVRFDKLAHGARASVCAGVADLRHTQFDALGELLEPLARHGLQLDHTPFARPSAVGASLTALFETAVLPALTPVNVDREHPFPVLASEQLALALVVHDDADRSRHVIIPLPASLAALQQRGDAIMRTELLVAACAGELLPDEQVREVALFRVIRANDIPLPRDFEDLRREVEHGLQTRPENPVVCLELDQGASRQLGETLATHLLQAPRDFVCRCPYPGVGPMGALQSMAEQLLQDQGQSSAFYPPHRPRRAATLEAGDGRGFAAIRGSDLLLHWPFDDFASLLALLHHAAEDPDVVAIKQTLYRTDRAVIEPLCIAASRGKEVTVVLELEARASEADNVAISRELERAGARVIYGLVNLKVHAKLLLIVRRERGELVQYANFATGNYHSGNARHYCDLSLFTADLQLGRDLTRLFNFITGSLPAPRTESVVVAPAELRTHLLGCIRREADNAQRGQPSGIWVKLNSLLDPAIIDALYAASAAGVPVHGIVRRHCALRPGVPGLSEHIQIKSIIGRYLEHARAVCFGNGHSLPSAHAAVYLSSGDWMPRNFDERVEVLVPVKDPNARKALLDTLFAANFRDTADSWIMDAHGHYKRPSTRDYRAQTYFAQTPLTP